MSHGVKSPHHTASFLFFVRSTSFPLYISQWWKIEGNRNFCWCRKNVLGEKQHRPMCRKTSSTLLNDASAIKVPKLNKTFPAGYLRNMCGCDLHLKPLTHLEHSCSTMTIVPFFFMFTSGLSALQLKQNRLKILVSMQ